MVVCFSVALLYSIRNRMSNVLDPMTGSTFLLVRGGLLPSSRTYTKRVVKSNIIRNFLQAPIWRVLIVDELRHNMLNSSKVSKPTIIS